MPANRSYVGEGGCFVVASALEVGSRKAGQWGNARGEPGKLFRTILLSELRLPPEYQRDQVGPKVDKIAQNFRWAAFGVLTVSLREDGRYYVIDGCHRAVAAGRVGNIWKVPCVVFRGLSLKQEAEAFVFANKNRAAPSGVHLLKAQIAAEDEKALVLRDLLNEAGLQPRSKGKGGDRRHSIQCVQALYLEIKVGHDLRGILAFIAKTWPSAENPWQNVVVKGCGTFGEDLKKQLKTDLYDEEAINAAGNFDLKTVLAMANARHQMEGRSRARAFADVLVDQWNRRHPRRSLKA